MQTRWKTNYDRELTAQGVGNLLCGLVGALPMTGVIVRSSTNVQAGAETKRSAILHGVWMLAFGSRIRLGAPLDSDGKFGGGADLCRHQAGEALGG